MTVHYNDNDDCGNAPLHVCHDTSVILQQSQVGMRHAKTRSSKRNKNNQNIDKKQNRKNAKLLRSMDMSNSRELLRLKHYLDTQVSMPYQLEIRGCQHQTITITTTTTTPDTATVRSTPSSICYTLCSGHDARKKQKTNHHCTATPRPRTPSTSSNPQFQQQRQVFAFTNVTAPAIIGVLRNHHACRPRHGQQEYAVATKVVLLELYHDQLLQVLYGGDHDHDNDMTSNNIINNHYWLQSSNVETLIIANSYCSMANLSSFMLSMSTTRQEQEVQNHHSSPCFPVRYENNCNSNNNYDHTNSSATFQRLTHLTLTSCHWPNSLYQDLIRSCSGTLQHLSCHLWAGGPKSIHNLLLGSDDSHPHRRDDDDDDVQQQQQQQQQQPWKTKEVQVDTRPSPSAKIAATTPEHQENKDGSGKCSTPFLPYNYLPRLESMDLRGSLTCNPIEDKDASTKTRTIPCLTFLAPNLTTVVLIPTWQSQDMHLKHVLMQLFGVDDVLNQVNNNRKLHTLILGKMSATSEDMEALGAYLMREECCIRRLHLLALDLKHEGLTTAKNDHHDDKNKNWQDLFLPLVRHNRSLMEISLHTTATTSAATNVVSNETRCPSSSRTVESRVTMINNDNHVQKELQSVVMRNIYLTRGLGRLVDVRLLPQYIYHHVNLVATAANKSCANGPSTRTLTMMTTRSPVDVLYFMVRQRPDLFCYRSHSDVDE